MADVFYNKTVTIYNRSVADDVMGAETWYPTVLENVRLLTTHGANIQTSGLESADSAKLFIKTNKLSKPYLKPLEWQNAKDKGLSFTLSSDGDFFVEGDTLQEDTDDDEFFQHMKLKYDNCYKITNADTYELIPHLEIGGA